MTAAGAGRTAEVGFSTLAAACFAGTVDEASAVVVERARAGRGGYACFCNVHVLSLARREPEVLQALSGATLLFPDGAPVAWLQRRVGAPGGRRIGGPDLMPRVVDVGRAHGLRHLLVGSSPVVRERLRARLAAAYPGAEIVGDVGLPVLDREALEPGEALEAVAALEPHVVWLALGAPKQELWMHRFAREAPSQLFLGVGAAFDFLAGTKPRAPMWMQRAGLEWAHRLASEPRRLSGRYVRTNAAFLGGTAVELVGRRRGAA